MAAVTDSRRSELKIGRRVLRAGEYVEVHKLPGVYCIQHFNASGTEVTLYGGRKGRRSMRTVTVDRIGTRPRDQETLRRTKGAP